MQNTSTLQYYWQQQLASPLPLTMLFLVDCGENYVIILESAFRTTIGRNAHYQTTYSTTCIP